MAVTVWRIFSDIHVSLLLTCACVVAYLSAGTTPVLSLSLKVLFIADDMESTTAGVVARTTTDAAVILSVSGTAHSSLLFGNIGRKVSYGKLIFR